MGVGFMFASCPRRILGRAWLALGWLPLVLGLRRSGLPTTHASAADFAIMVALTRAMVKLTSFIDTWVGLGALRTQT